MRAVTIENSPNAPMSVDEISLMDAIERLNWNYGRGEVVSVTWEGRDPANCEGTFTRKPFSCEPETRRFRAVDGTVYALGHQRRMN